MDSALIARQHLGWRMNSGAVPDTFQTNIGKDFEEWRDQLGTQLKDLSGMGSTLPAGESPTFSPELSGRAECTTGGVGLCCIPLGIHRLNTLYFSTASTTDINPKPADIHTLRDFETACSAVHAKKNITPIALGGSWALTVLVHENLLPSIAGPRKYLDFWNGVVSLDQVDELLRPVYQRVVDWKINGWFNDKYVDLSWDQAIKLLFGDGGQPAAFTIMGDWVTAEFEAAGHYAGFDFDSIEFPVDSNVGRSFVYTADCFPLPKGGSDPGAAEDFLGTLLSAEGQKVFNQKKGAIPGRSDDLVDPSSFKYGKKSKYSGDRADKDQRHKTWVDFNKGTDITPVRAVSGYLKHGVLGGLNEALVDMLDKEDAQIGLDYWTKNKHYCEICQNCSCPP